MSLLESVRRVTHRIERWVKYLEWSTRFNLHR